MLSRPQARSSLERSGISWSPLWKCVRTFVYAFEPSPFSFWAEGSNEGPSTQHFRSNLHPIYQHITGPYVHVHMRTFYASASCRRVTRCEPTSRQYTAKNHESYYLIRQPETPAIAIHTRGGYLF